MKKKDSLTLSRRNLFKGAALTGAAVAFGGLDLLRPRNAVAQKASPIAALPGYYPFAIGDIQGLVLSDGSSRLAPVNGLVVSNGSEEVLNKQLTDRFLPTDRVDVALNTFLIRANGKTILFDVGYGEEGTDSNGRQLTNLAAAGLNPSDIDIIAISHCHPDHLWGMIDAEGKAIYPNAEIVLHENEYNFWNNETNANAKLQGLLDGFTRNLGPLKEKVRTLKNGGEIVPGVTIMPAHGHTPGHSNFMIESNGEQLLLTVDVANHPVLFLQNPEYNFGFDLDKPKAVETRKRVLSMAATDKLQILAYHFPFPGIGYIRKATGDSFEYIARPWGT